MASISTIVGIRLFYCSSINRVVDCSIKSIDIFMCSDVHMSLKVAKSTFCNLNVQLHGMPVLVHI